MSEVFGPGCRSIVNYLSQGHRACVFPNVVHCELIETETNTRTRYSLEYLVFLGSKKGVGIDIDRLDEIGTFADWRLFLTIVFVIFLLETKEDVLSW